MVLAVKQLSSPSWIRTNECSSQSAVPYHLAIELFNYLIYKGVIFIDYPIRIVDICIIYKSYVYCKYVYRLFIFENI